jgi:signal transduction histidine kinase
LCDPAVEAPRQPDEDRKYSALSLIAGVSLEPMRATLGKLAGILIGLSLGIWLMALLAGRAVCGRALAPVRRMAAAAREMDGADLHERLPAVASGDELEDLATAFNSLLSRQQASLERERRFAGDASHQLRTPLAAILGQIEVALRRERPPEEYERVLTTVHEKALHLRHIVESLLFLARVENEALPPERERVDLAQWVPQHLQSWADRERFDDISFENSEGDVLSVKVQPVLLGELVNILLDNACRYSPPGTRITVRLCRQGQAVSLQVEDCGPGIAESDLLHLFTPFFRSADVRRRKIDGVGLGLSIARRLAESFDGEIVFANRAGVGACFTLRLPGVLMASNAKPDGIADTAEVGSK